MFCRSDNKGFTLIEILVAIVLFLIGAVSVARLQTWSTRGTTFGKEALVATTAAQTVIEQLKEQAALGNFATILNNNNVSGPAFVRNDSNPGNIQAGTGGAAAQTVPGMTIQWTVGNTAGAVGSRYTTVTVTVQWAQNTRQYQTQTIISELQHL